MILPLANNFLPKCFGGCMLCCAGRCFVHICLNAINANGNCGTGLICDLTTKNKVLLSFFFAKKKRRSEENENVLQPENTQDTLSQKLISLSSI